MKTCFFIGHREADERLLPALKQTVRQHILEYGVTDFVVGDHGGFDRLAAAAVIAARKEFPQVSLTLLLPYHPAIRPVRLRPGFDGSFYPPQLEQVPPRYAIVRANRYMVDSADYLIAYVWHPASNARKLLEYARKRSQLHITVLGQDSLLQKPDFLIE